MTTQQLRRGSASARWHHPHVHQGPDGWGWECRCGAASWAADAQPWRLALVAARLHAHHATR